MLRELIKRFPLADYNHHSRVHRLNGYADNYFVKRDDELSFGITGSKIRKYLSLIPSLKSRRVKEAVLVGGPSSNNIVGLSQLLIEEGIQPVLFLCGRKPETPSGNLVIAQLLVNEANIHWHGRGCWPRINQLAQEYAKGRESCVVIPEGASCAESMPGALTLPLDIIENEKSLGFSFEHLVCDSGTGMMAAGLILGNSFLEREIHHHILLLAEDEEVFRENLEKWRGVFETLLGKKIGFTPRLSCYKPSNAPSFGAVNARVRREIATLAREEGILSDPIYSAKLFAEARKMPLKGKALLIHSGGALGNVGKL